VFARALLTLTDTGRPLQALDVDNPWENAKFCVLHMLHNANDPALSSGLAACNTYDAAWYGARPCSVACADVGALTICPA
jgi:hypothetical protein